MKKVQVQQVLVEDDGLQIGFVLPQTDVKAAGLIQAHTLLIPRGFDYDDEIRAVEDALNYLVNDVLDDWDKLGPPEEEP